MALTPLSHTRDSRLAGSDLDVRGWDVRTDDDEKVGSVDDMLVDDSGRPRYLDVDLGLLRKHVLVPIGQARTDDRRDVVWLPGMTRDRFDDVPEWNHDMSSLDRNYEDRLAAAYHTSGTDAAVREGSRSRAGAGELRELDDLDGYHIPKDEPNPKGWTVVTADGREVGEVDELIVDTAAMMVRYLDCDLDQDELGFDADRERHVLIPLQQVRLDRDEKHVLVDGLTSDRLRDLPVYGGLPIANDFESRVREAFRGGSGATGSTGSRGTESESRSSGPNRYDDDRFDDRRFYGSRLNRAAASMEDEAPSLRDREPMDDMSEREDGAERAEREQRAARAEAEGRARAAEDRQMQADADERRTADDAGRAADSSRLRPDEEVRIRVRGDEIIVEKRPKE